MTVLIHGAVVSRRIGWDHLSESLDWGLDKHYGSHFLAMSCLASPTLDWVQPDPGPHCPGLLAVAVISPMTKSILGRKGII